MNPTGSAPNSGGGTAPTSTNLHLHRLPPFLPTGEDNDVFVLPRSHGCVSFGGPTFRDLDEWNRQNQAVIQERDDNNNSSNRDLRESSSKSIDGFNANLRVAQDKLAEHKSQIDSNLVASVSSTSEKKWDAILVMIDFERTDFQ